MNNTVNQKLNDLNTYIEWPKYMNWMHAQSKSIIPRRNTKEKNIYFVGFANNDNDGARLCFKLRNEHARYTRHNPALL